MTLEQARADLAAVQLRLGEQYPKTDAEMTVAVTPLKDVVVGGVGRSLWMLFGAVSVLLLIACTNIATLLLARGARREQEVALRYSLGASRRAVAAQLLTEATLLAIAGAAAGLLVAAGTSAAAAATRAGSAAARRDRRRPAHPGLHDGSSRDGVVDVRRCSRRCAAPWAASRWRGLAAHASRPGTGCSGRWWVFRWRCRSRCSSAPACCCAASSGSRTSTRLRAVARAGVPRLRAVERAGNPVIRRVTATLAAVGTVPGVEAVATTTALSGVPAPEAGPAEITITGGVLRAGSPMIAEYRIVSPSYFATMQIPVVGVTSAGIQRRRIRGGLPVSRW